MAQINHCLVIFCYWISMTKIVTVKIVVHKRCCIAQIQIYILCARCVLKAGAFSRRWSPRGRLWPRGHILMSLALALASKVKSLALASKPLVLENYPVLSSRTALIFELLKFCRSSKNFFWRPFFVDRLKKFFSEFFWRSPEKKFLRPFFFFFFLENACRLCPWPQAYLSLASSILVLERAVLGLGRRFFCVLGLGLEPFVLDSTSAFSKDCRFVA